MRLFYLLSLPLLLSITARCQAPADAISPEDPAFNKAYAKRSIPVVTGRLINIPADELKSLTISYSLVTPFSQLQVRKTTFAGPDGTFQLQLDYPFPYQQLWFGVGDVFYAGLYANKDLYIELDMKKIKEVKEVNFNGVGVRYLGTDGPLNDYMNNYILYKRSDQLRLSAEINQSLSDDTARTFREFNRLFDSVKMIQDSYIAAHPSPYGWILENERLAEYYGEISVQHWGRAMKDSLWKKVAQQKSYLVSNSGAGLYRYLTMYVGTLPATRLPATGNAALLQTLDLNIHRLDSLFPPAKADFLKFELATSEDLNEQKISLEHILHSMHTPWCMAVIKNEYQRTADKVDEINKTLAASAGGSQHTSFGSPILETPFGASMYKVSGIKAGDFLSGLRQSFPGKAILIDLWATWCGPCVAEMPLTKHLQEEAKDLPVVFVYLCTINSSTEDKWKTKVMEMKQPGIHFLIDAPLDAELSRYFSFSGYPGHALIDKAGKYRPEATKDLRGLDNLATLTALLDK